MATDRERAVMEALGRASALFMSSEVPGTQQVMPSEKLEAIGHDLLMELSRIERALAPTDAEREAMREALSLLQRCESSMTVDLAIHRGSTDEDGDRSPTMRLVREVRASLARLDAATGGRGDG